MLIGFTVMQHAFAGGITHNIVTDVERRALALTGAGDMIWDWDVSADRIYTSPETEHLLGLKRGALEGPASRWLDVLHRARPRPLPRRARRRAGAAPRPADAGFPPAHAGRPLPVVRAQGAAGGRLRRRGGAAGRHADRRHRIQDRRGAAAARRGARQPHRPAEPPAVHRPAGSGAGLRQVRSGDPRHRGGDRSRPLQAGQRFRRHRGRRLDPADAGAPARPAAQAAGHAGAAHRRPVRHDPAVGARSDPADRLRRDHPPDAARADHLQRPRDFPHRLDRACARRRPAEPHRGGAQGRRACDVSRQAHRRRPHRGVQAGDARAQDRPADARIRAAPRARARGDHHPLPADRAAGGPLGRGLRGAGALGPSEDGPHVAVGVHQHRRGDRPDRRSRPVRAGAHRAPAQRLAAHRAARASRCSPASTCRRGSCCATT